ncbi:MAG: hypothetical protein ACREQE_10865 [Candidatus Binataceae bacterium]
MAITKLMRRPGLRTTLTIKNQEGLTMTAMGLILAILVALMAWTGPALAADNAAPKTSNGAVTTANGQSNVPNGVKEFANGIPIGTVITMSNWRQYKQFMPVGMADLFEGTYFWKMPADVQLKVGPTKLYPLPQGYADATEKYGSQTRAVLLAGRPLSSGELCGGAAVFQPAEAQQGLEDTRQ